jgi:membrane protease YdiL (CAAX protease family)
MVLWTLMHVPPAIILLLFAYFAGFSVAFVDTKGSWMTG